MVIEYTEPHPLLPLVSEVHSPSTTCFCSWSCLNPPSRPDPLPPCQALHDLLPSWTKSDLVNTWVSSLQLPYQCGGPHRVESVTQFFFLVSSHLLLHNWYKLSRHLQFKHFIKQYTNMKIDITIWVFLWDFLKQNNLLIAPIFSVDLFPWRFPVSFWCLP